MIEKIRISGYRGLRNLEVIPHTKLNILVGNNEAGKSTILEALALALTGRVNGRPAQEELNPFWFNQSDVVEFFEKRLAGSNVAPPTIEIELFLADRPELLRRFVGAHNSEIPTNTCAGVVLQVVPDEQYGEEIESYFDSGPTEPILPVEYYKVVWRTFGDVTLTTRPRELTTAIIDSRTIRSTSSVDFHLRQMLSDHIDEREKAKVSLAYRAVKSQMTAEHLADVNREMAELEGTFGKKALSLAMDQTSRSSWDSSITPHVDSLPFGMVGQGQQAAVKIALAVSRRADDARVIMVEEPENHQSHTHLNQLIDRIVDLSGADQQIFLTTHSSFVLNRLGLDNLLFVNNGDVSSVGKLSPETVSYFQKLPGYDTLRMVLAEKSVLVEGPSDEILFERFYMDSHGKRPIENGIDVISMRSLSTARSLELAGALGKPCAALRDNDGKEPTEIVKDLADLISDERKVFVGDIGLGRTLEPQIQAVNDENILRSILDISDRAVVATWMKNNKTESAFRIASADQKITPPPYFKAAIEFIDGR